MPSIFGTEPDYRLLETALGRGTPERVPAFEFFSDGGVQDGAIGDVAAEPRLPYGEREDFNAYIRRQYLLGYDCLTPWVTFHFGGMGRHYTVDSEGHSRDFLTQEDAMIVDRASFERFPWPEVGSLDLGSLEYLAQHLPEGMKLVASIGSGLLEWGMWLMGAERFCLMLYDDPELVDELLDAINVRQVAAARAAASHPDVMAVIIGDDLGFKTQTFLPPAALRRFIFPGHRRIADAVHSFGKKYILHACGNIENVMPDLIETVGIDARHSFEDQIVPVTEAKRQWGDRVAIVGGVDIHKLATLEPEELRKYVRGVLEACTPGGGYVLGSGNSIPNYIPPVNLRVMLEEAFRA